MPGFFDNWPEREPSQDNAFAHSRIDRRSEQRDPHSLARALAAGDARLYLFSTDKVLVRPGVDGPDPLFTPTEAAALGADADKTVLLGWTSAGPRLATAVGPEVDMDRHALELRDLRGLANEALIRPEHLGALAQGRSLLLWHQRHGFCAKCGSATDVADGGTRRICPSCGAEHFPRTDPVVIMLVVSGDECLLGRGARFTTGWYSCLAGYMEPGETIEAAVRREIGEEAGIEVGRVRYHSSQPWPFPSTLMIGCHAEALTRDIVLDREELEDARWFKRDEIRLMLSRTHPEGFGTPPAFAIANHLLRSWVNHG